MFGDRGFYSKMFAIVIPIIIQNTITNVVSLLDNIMVGRVGTLEMSAVAIDNQLLFVFYICIFGGLSGAGIFATQYAGAKDDDGVRSCFRAKLMIAFAMVAVALVVFIAFPEKLVSLYLAKDTSAQDVESTLGFAMDYLSVMLAGVVPFALSQVYSSSLRELGETKMPMIASVTAILVNLVFNYLLIFGAFGFPKLGVVGAAVATVLSRYVEMLILIIFTHVNSSRFPFIKGAYRSMKMPRKLAGDILKRGMPLLVNEALWSAGMATLNQCYSVRGLDVVAAVNISSTVANLFNVVFLSMGNAIAIMVGQHLGANEVDKAKQTAWRLITATVGGCVVMGALLAACSPFIPYIYNTTENVRELATKLLLVGAAIMPVMAFAHDCYFTIRSGGRTLLTFVFDSCSMWLIAVPLAMVLANFTDLPIVPLFIVVQLIEVFKSAIGFILVKKGIWIRNIIDN
ncbi:MAG: MATE family efflux transporter [Clostridia bacterium]|nr:MATE family efflux transporter [Clostridia bacterium]